MYKTTVLEEQKIIMIKLSSTNNRQNTKKESFKINKTTKIRVHSKSRYANEKLNVRKNLVLENVLTV